eukprot:1176689-Prorocentrum_minimum.AAC.2
MTLQPTGGRVGGSHDGGARVEHSGDARLGNGDGLLLHGLVDGHAVLRTHLVELVDAHHATIREHHGPPFQVGLPGRGVLDDGRRETRRRRALAGCVDRDGRGLVHELEQLGLGSGGVTQQEHVHVSPQPCPVGQTFPCATEE